MPSEIQIAILEEDVSDSEEVSERALAWVWRHLRRRFLSAATAGGEIPLVGRIRIAESNKGSGNPEGMAHF